MGTEGYSPGVKRPGRESDHSSPSGAELKNGGAILLLPHTPSLPSEAHVFWKGNGIFFLI
jgi:hypothetical protein